MYSTCENLSDNCSNTLTNFVLSLFSNKWAVLENMTGDSSQAIYSNMFHIVHLGPG
jgi:hypothetical protein